MHSVLLDFDLRKRLDSNCPIAANAQSRNATKMESVGKTIVSERGKKEGRKESSRVPPMTKIKKCLRPQSPVLFRCSSFIAELGKFNVSSGKSLAIMRRKSYLNTVVDLSKLSGTGIYCNGCI